VKVTEIEKLNQLVSRTDMTGNEKVEWLTDFIDKNVTDQLRLNDISNQKEVLKRKLCGSDNSIRPNKVPKKYQRKVNRLIWILDLWERWVNKS